MSPKKKLPYQSNILDSFFIRRPNTSAHQRSIIGESREENINPIESSNINQEPSVRPNINQEVSYPPHDERRKEERKSMQAEQKQSTEFSQNKAQIPKPITANQNSKIKKQEDIEYLYQDSHQKKEQYLPSNKISRKKKEEESLSHGCQNQISNSQINQANEEDDSDQYFFNFMRLSKYQRLLKNIRKKIGEEDNQRFLAIVRKKIMESEDDIFFEEMKKKMSEEEYQRFLKIVKRKMENEGDDLFFMQTKNKVGEADYKLLLQLIKPMQDQTEVQNIVKKEELHNSKRKQARFTKPILGISPNLIFSIEKKKIIKEMEGKRSFQLIQEIQRELKDRPKKRKLIKKVLSSQIKQAGRIYNTLKKLKQILKIKFQCYKQNNPWKNEEFEKLKNNELEKKDSNDDNKKSLQKKKPIKKKKNQRSNSSSRDNENYRQNPKNKSLQARSSFHHSQKKSRNRSLSAIRTNHEEQRKLKEKENFLPYLKPQKNEKMNSNANQPNKSQKQANRQKRKKNRQEINMKIEKGEYEEFKFYVKTRFPYQFRRMNIFPKRSEGLQELKKITKVGYVDCLESFFTYEKVTPFHARTQLTKYVLESGEQIQNVQEDKEKMIKIKSRNLDHIQSVFMISKSIGSYPVLNLIQAIKANPTSLKAKICIEVHMISQDLEQQLNKNGCFVYPREPREKNTNGQEKTFKQFRNFKEQTRYDDFKKQIERHFNVNQNKEFKPFIYERMRERYQCGIDHLKVWFIKFKKTDKNGPKIRMVFSTSNLQQTGWKYGTNMFWSRDFEIKEDSQENLIQPYKKYQDGFGINFNKDFIQTLKNIFSIHVEKWKLFDCLGINLDKIKVSRINFVLIPTSPETFWPKNQNNNTLCCKTGLDKIKQLTQKYYGIKGNQNLKKSATVHITTPNYMKCTVKLVDDVFDAFVDNEQRSKQQNMKRVKIYYPSNEFIYDRIKEEYDELINEEKKPFKNKITSTFMFVSENYNTYLTTQSYKTNLGIKEEIIRNNRFKYGLFVHENEKNDNHRLQSMKHRKTQGYSIPHFKAILTLFKGQDQVLEKNKGIFYFGSHNFTPSSWQKDYSQKNYELGLLFFDVPGILSHLLPLQIDLKNNPSLDYTLSNDYQKCRSMPFTYYRIEKFLEVVKEQQQRFYSQIIKNLKKQIKNKGKQCMFDYPLVKSGPQCLQLKVYCEKDASFHQKYEQFKTRIKNSLWSSKGKKYTNRLQNPDISFCYKNKMDVIMKADMVVRLKDKIQIDEVWFFSSNKGYANYNRQLALQAYKYYQTKDHKLKFIKLNIQLFKQEERGIIRNFLYEPQCIKKGLIQEINFDEMGNGQNNEAEGNQSQRQSNYNLQSIAQLPSQHSNRIENEEVIYEQERKTQRKRQ